MVAPNWVLIDSCVWVPFFNRKTSIEKSAVTELLKYDRVALIGPVLAEVLRGFRRDEEADWVASSLRGVHYLELTWDIWTSAARLSRTLAAKGHRLPLTDVVLATAALHVDCPVYSTDPHFDVIPGIKRYFPDAKV